MKIIESKPARQGETVSTLPKELSIRKKNKFMELCDFVHSSNQAGFVNFTQPTFTHDAVGQPCNGKVSFSGFTVGEYCGMNNPQGISMLAESYRARIGLGDTSPVLVTITVGSVERLIFQIQADARGEITVVLFTGSKHVRNLIQEKSRWFIARLRKRGIKVTQFSIEDIACMSNY